MPLFEKARIEVYLPDLDRPAYLEFLEELQSEFTYTFGGSTLVRGLNGRYLSQAGIVMRDPVNVVYTDTPFQLSANESLLSEFVPELRDAALCALDEEGILVAVIPIYHPTDQS